MWFLYDGRAFNNIPIFIFLCSLAAAQTLDPVSARCSRWYHQSTLKGNTLFINGGAETYSSKSSDDVILGNNQKLVTIDMSKPWDAKEKSPESSVEKTASLGAGTLPPSLVQGALFSSGSGDSKIFTYGGTTFMGNTSFPGYVPNNPKGAGLWSYDTSAKAWFQFSTDNETWRPSWGFAAEAPKLGLGFYFNGQIDDFETTTLGKAKVPIEGMMVVDAGNRATRNISTKSITAENPRRGGSLTYVSDVGSKGALVLLGGIVAGSAAQNDGWPDSEADMSRIDIFDVASLDASPNSGSWYTQPAAGDIPKPRIDFCVVSASVADGSSHTIYMYGGRDPFYNIPFDDVYALSLPSFTWTLLYNGTSPRFGHTCHLVGNSQMLRVGGSLTNEKWAIMNIPSTIQDVNGTINTTTANCDNETNGVSILDLTNITWGSAYDPNAAPYSVPQKVVDKIGGRGDGQATMLEPSGGFAQPGLANVFKTSQTSSNETAAPSATAAPAHHSSHAGAIAGGVVGGVVGLALIAGLAVFFLRRRRRRSSRQRSESPSGRKDLPSLEIDGDTKVPPEMSPETTVRGELSGNDGVCEKGDHDMWEKSRRVYGNGNGIIVHEKGDGAVFEKGDDHRDGELYQNDRAKTGELHGSDVNEMDGSTVAGTTDRGSMMKEKQTPTTESHDTPR